MCTNKRQVDHSRNALAGNMANGQTATPRWKKAVARPDPFPEPNTLGPRTGSLRRGSGQYRRLMN